MQSLTLLIASAHQGQRAFLTAQLDADGHTVYEADNSVAAVGKLSTYAIDVMILAALERRADSPALLRAVRAGEHPRIHPGQPVITIGADDELTVLRAYESGSDHHLADSTSYVLLRAVLASVVRRALEEFTRRHIQVGDIHIDVAARAVDVNAAPVRLDRRQFDLLVKFASDPTRVFSKNDLSRAIWGHSASGRTIDTHVTRLRRQLSDAGAQHPLRNRRGQGWALTTPALTRPRQ